MPFFSSVSDLRLVLEDNNLLGGIREWLEENNMAEEMVRLLT